ncbi:hypothetical protein SCUCBS95973_009723 [Sporothrix curviconia]|uniref:Protein kinase domain-containing protein n=1 Tax=Sporothrix curviconia TaxID=1260050 RepID=A0ABP0CXA6_9PEZI
MYPDWPETTADLVPLPLCDGPKLAAFDFQGDQQIDFLEYLGEGLHAHVVKVSIKGKEYALKLFRFVDDHDWYGPGDDDSNEDRDKLTLFAQYSEPFNSECRAFARLQEAGHPELATACYGYVILDEAQERELMDRFKLEFNCGIEQSGQFDMRGRYLGKRSGKPPPIRGILKELGTRDPYTNPPDFSVVSAKKVLLDLKKLHQLGIISHDLRRDQLINGKICDFSSAITIPHFLTNPELNPRLTEKQKHRMMREAFHFTIGDFWNFEEMLRDTLDEPRQTSKLDRVPVLPGGIFRYRADSKYQLRRSPDRPNRTRYGYIQTDQELVACCFSAGAETTPGGKSKDREDWAVEIMPVPWSAELRSCGEPHILTTELALWWLCMLALSDGHHALVPKADIVPINKWDTVNKGDGRGWVWRRRYSQVETPANDFMDDHDMLDIFDDST